MIVAPTNRLEPYEERIIEFKGLNRQPDTEPGEMVSMLNLSSNEAPILTQRRKRATYDNVPEGITKVYMMQSVVDYSAGRAVKLAVLGEDESGIGFWLDADKQSVAYLNSHNISLSSIKNDEVVLMTTKLCFFPSRVYFDLKTHSFGKLDTDFSTKQLVTLTYDATKETTEVAIAQIPGVDVDLSEIAIGDVVDFYSTAEAAIVDKGATTKDANSKPMTKLSSMESETATEIQAHLGDNWYVYDTDKTDITPVYGDHSYDVLPILESIIEENINKADRVSLVNTDDGDTYSIVVQWWKEKDIVAEKTVSLDELGLSFEPRASLD